jgi:hypothetical protein
MASNNRFAPSSNGVSHGNAPFVSTADQLLEQFQRVEKAWKMAEDKLASTHVPIDVRVKVGSYTDYADDDPHEQYPIAEMTTYLGYCRVKGARRICEVVRRDFIQGPPEFDESITPIVECPVDDRLAMFDTFQRLYDEALAVSKAYVSNIKEKVDQFEQSLIPSLF